MRMKKPFITLEEFGALMPVGWDDHRLVAISPWVFESALTKTCQILVEGDYNGIIEPDVHYFSIKREFSNIDEALERLKDTESVQNIVDRTYEVICGNENFMYKTFARLIEGAITEQE